MGISEDLSCAGISVRDHFLDSTQVRALLGCLSERRTRGDFTEARVGSGRTLQKDSGVRGDRTCWLAEPLFAAEQVLLSRIDELRMQLNRDLYLGLFELELHYAWYPPGAGYARHVDQPQGSLARRVSLILYLNENWEAGAGGELELFDAHGCRRVEPLAGRLVCFLSAGREHAVLEARRDRCSLAGWFRTRDGASRTALNPAE